MDKHINSIANRLSLRIPQRDSLKAKQAFGKYIKPHWQFWIGASIAAAGVIVSIFK